MGLRTVLLTGDHRAVAHATGAAIGVDEVVAEVLPADKVAAIELLQGQGRTVAMVGDGVNDAAALARADLGLAVVSGTDVTIAAADVILVRDDLDVSPTAIGRPPDPVHHPCQPGPGVRLQRCRAADCRGRSAQPTDLQRRYGPVLTAGGHQQSAASQVRRRP